MGLVVPGTLSNKEPPFEKKKLFPKTVQGFKMLLALPILLLSFSLGNGMSLVQEERLAFMLCEADGEEGLTWTEVEDCEERFAYLLTEMGQDVPTEADFNSVDLNLDGILEFDEWAAWALKA